MDKRKDRLCVGIVVLTVLITVLFMNGKAIGITPLTDPDEGDELFTANDLCTQWDTENATRITLTGDGATVSGNGAYANRGNVYIVYAGKYTVTGELVGGNIVVDADGDDKIWILLDGVSVDCTDDAALRVEQADKVFVTLRGENTLKSGENYDADKVKDGVDGVIYARDDLTFNGDGTLQVTAGYRHGIVCNDDLVFAGGGYSVTAPEDAVHANDSVRICNSVLDLTAGDDGITVTNDDESAFFYMESGNVNISECYEGIESVQVTIAGGSVEIFSSDDGINACGKGENSLIAISGGEVTVRNESGRDADGLDSNGSILISGGDLRISVMGNGSNAALDYGKENGGKCIISGGTVVACGGSSMAEGFDSDSPQGFLMETVNGSDGDTVVLTDTTGKELIREEIPYDFTSLVLSTPQVITGNTYTLKIGDTEKEVTVTAETEQGGDRMGQGDRGERQMPGGNFNPGDDNTRQRQENPQGAERPEMPQGMDPPQLPENGQMPEMPENGKAPEDGTIPEIPQDGTPPEIDGTMPEDPDGFSRDFGGKQQDDRTREPDTSTEQSDLSPAVLILTLSCVAVLAIGIFIAAKKKV